MLSLLVQATTHIKAPTLAAHQNIQANALLTIQVNGDQMGKDAAPVASTSGNLHPYDPEHLIVNGLGGAFLHPTHVFSASRFASIPDPEVDAHFVQDMPPRGRQMGHAHMGQQSKSSKHPESRGSSPSGPSGSVRGSSPSGGSPRGRSPMRGSATFPGRPSKLPNCDLCNSSVSLAHKLWQGMSHMKAGPVRI